MEIKVIQEKSNVFFDQYKILLNGELTYTAKSKLFSWLSKIAVFDLAGKPVCTIVKNTGSSNLDFSIEFENGISKIRSESFLEYHIRISKGTLGFYEQKENTILIFMNEKQIGVIIKNTRKTLAQDKYLIQYEKSEIDPEMLIGFVIAYDMESKDKSNDIDSWDMDI